MAAEGIRIQAPPTSSEVKNVLGVQEKKGATKDVELHPGDSPKVIEEQKPDAQYTAPVVTGALEPSATGDAEKPKTGEKRELDETKGPTEGHKNGEETADTAIKKQKTEEPAKPENGASDSTATKEDGTTTAATNGEKKKPGRPKKLKEIANKLAPRSAEGIGSRTRSRTKAT